MHDEHLSSAIEVDLDVEYWVVCYDHPIPQGKLIADPLSPMFEALSQAQDALPAIKARIPEAYISRGTAFFDAGRPEKMRERAELLSRIQRVS